jgi:hypothetical protein
MQTKLVDYTSYVKARRSLTIFSNLWEKTLIKLYLESSDEFNNQLLDCQSKTTQISKAGGLVEGIHKMLSEFSYQMYCGQRLPPMEVMTRIKQAFVD